MSTKLENSRSKEVDKENDRLFDVAKPGKTPAQATSRPVIIGHGKSVKNDPMFKSEPQNIAQNNSQNSAQNNDQDKSVTEDRPTLHGKVLNPQAPRDDTEDVALNEPQNDQKKYHRDSESSESQDEQKLAEVENLTESREYFVPIGAARKRRSYALLSLLLLIVLVLAGLNFAIDAELIDSFAPALTDVL